MADLYVDYKEHYNSDYWSGRKQYQTPNGQTHFYHGPALTWDGFTLVHQALAPLLNPKSVLDIGCGGGDLVDRFRQTGVDAWGVDISEHAVRNCVPGMRGRVALADITTCPELKPLEGDAKFPETFDLVMSTDLLEHIYEDDLSTTFDWLVNKSNRWLFFLVATAQHPSHPFANVDKLEFVHKKGTPIPKEFEATAISGHVNVRGFRWWLKFFASKGLKIRYDLSYFFQMSREANENWQRTGGWNMCNTWCLEKV